jgi:hypothetical protein
MRPLILDLDHSILDLPGGRLIPGGRELLQALASAGVPLALLTVADAGRRAEKGDAFAAVLRREGFGDAALQLADRLVAVDAAADDETATRRRYKEGLRAAATSCGAEEGHAHTAVLLSRDPSHLDVARAAGLLAYPLGGDATAKADTVHDGRADAAIDLVETLRWHPCDKRRAAAKGRLASAVAKRKAADPGITELVAGVSETRLRATMEELVAWGTRWAFAPHIDQVTASIREAFLAAGYPATTARFQPFSMPDSASQRNVLCGSATPGDGVVLLCAHYDSISRTPRTAAPGCDDNASGIAVMLEAARVLRDAGLDQHILCAAFGGEEQGLYGSRACAEIAAAESWDIRLVVNLDMVGYRDPAHPDLVTVEFDQGNVQPGNDAAARGYAMTMAQAAADYTSLQVEHTDIWNSDYMPFEAKGYACIGLYDGAADAPFYHSPEDTLDKVDLARVAEVTRLVVATVATIARPVSAAA